MTPRQLAEQYIRTVERDNPRLTLAEVYAAALLSMAEDVLKRDGSGFTRGRAA